jgi:hypothetical protein
VCGKPSSFSQDESYCEYERNPSLFQALVIKRNYQKALDYVIVKNTAILVDGEVKIVNFDGLKEVADRGCSLSQFQVAMYYLGRSEVSLYRHYVRLSAEQGFLKGEAYLGSGLLSGSNGFGNSEKDDEVLDGFLFLSYIQRVLKAATGGDAKSQHTLACIFKRGLCNKQINMKKVYFPSPIYYRHSITVVFRPLNLSPVAMLSSETY